MSLIPSTADQRPESGSSLIVLIVAIVVIGLAAWIVMSRMQQSSDFAGSEGLGVAAPTDQARQQRTISDMQVIGRAVSLMRADTGAHPQTLVELERGRYLALVPSTDAWGNAWVYEAGEDGYTLASLGADGRPGPAPPVPWTTGAYDCDLVLINGQVTQGPSGR